MNTASKSPNILLVFADQWTFWATGYQGCTQVRTPHLDRFAAEGVNCHQAISGTPVCTAARASLLTGLRPNAHGLMINDAPLRAELPGFGKHFAAVGYDTAWIGKWHVNGHHRYGYVPPERRHGFAYFKALECTHDYNHSRYYAGDDPEIKVWSGYDTFAQTDDLIGWLGARKDAKREQPFLAVLSWGPPHNPYETAPAEYRARHRSEDIVLRGNVPPEKEAETRQNLAGYFAHCEALDEAFGRLLATLKAQGLDENTIVVFTSDHGDMLGSHGLREKQGPWEESLRIPMLFRGPGLPSGVRNDTILDFIDLWPTLAGLAGVPVVEKIHGCDLSRELAGCTKPTDNVGFYGNYARYGSWRQQAGKVSPLYECREARGLRTERWLYAEDLKGPWLLHDLTNDPLELTNLVNSPEHTAVCAQLAHRLRARLRDYDDEFLRGEDYIARWGYAVDERGTIPLNGWYG